jgi:hypothetical protein
MRFPALLALAACGAPPTPATPAPTRPASAASTPAPIAAAGLYWRPYVTCDECAKPAAIVAYLVGDEGEARRIQATLADNMALGLPFAVHTDQLGVTPAAIAIVIGAFATAGEAERAAAGAATIAGQRAQVVPVGATDADTFVTPEHEVVSVDRGHPVPAWSQRDFEAASAARDASTDPSAHSTLEAMHAFVQRELRTHKPLCTIAPGELFVVREDDIRWYEAAPVRCGDQLAYIAWTASLLGHAVVVPDDRGHRLYQVVGATCDSPEIKSWRYDDAGRHDEPAAPSQLARGGC